MNKIVTKESTRENKTGHTFHGLGRMFGDNKKLTK